jgi:hypothetical protein
VTLDDELLLELIEQSPSVFMQVLVIDVATRNGEWPRQPTPALRAFPNAWLRELLQRSIRGIGDLPEQSEGVDTRRAEGTLLALMQLGRDLTVAAAATLLRHDCGRRRETGAVLLAMGGRARARRT